MLFTQQLAKNSFSVAFVENELVGRTVLILAIILGVPINNEIIINPSPTAAARRLMLPHRSSELDGK
jgi:hypothetical protein